MQIKPNITRKVLHIASSGKSGFLALGGGRGYSLQWPIWGVRNALPFSGFRYIKGNLQVEGYEGEEKFIIYALTGNFN